MHQYLKASEYIDWQHPAILTRAEQLAAGAPDEESLARRCYVFVRDQIRHSWDFRENPVTCRASDVLQYATGFCYAKSHLLAALLRANGIPAGLCYQRLRLENGGFCLHGLNAVYLQRHGWYRADPRGNTGEIAAEFLPPQERLAFSIAAEGEADLPGVWAEPLPPVVGALEGAGSYRELAENLPDAEAKDLEEVICDY